MHSARAKEWKTTDQRTHILQQIDFQAKEGMKLYPPEEKKFNSQEVFLKTKLVFKDAYLSDKTVKKCNE